MASWNGDGAGPPAQSRSTPLGPPPRELSRVQTLHSALRRLGLLDCGQTSIDCHVVGADEREGFAAAETAAVFAPLLVHLGGSDCVEVRLVLCGPNVFSPRDGDAAVTVAARGGRTLTCQYFRGLYDDLALPAPDLAIGFHPGIWGYDSWRSTLRHLRDANVPFCMTSYNTFEAEDDEDALQGFKLHLRWAWPPELNPSRSRDEEVRQTKLPHTLVENSHWQCVHGAAP